MICLSPAAIHPSPSASRVMKARDLSAHGLRLSAGVLGLHYLRRRWLNGCVAVAGVAYMRFCYAVEKLRSYSAWEPQPEISSARPDGTASAAEGSRPFGEKHKIPFISRGASTRRVATQSWCGWSHQEAAPCVHSSLLDGDRRGGSTTHLALIRRGFPTKKLVFLFCRSPQLTTPAGITCVPKPARRGAR